MPKLGNKKFAYTKKGYAEYKRAKLKKIAKRKNRQEVYDQGAVV
tara:strand:+ start:2925 stop:3056 length:132 start_codon:yes stop_codon:yes gene_type:complete